MNKVGIYFAYWTREWQANYPMHIQKVARLGFDILEVCTANFVDLGKAERQEIRRAAQDAGIEYAKRTLEMISDMGGNTYGGINYASWPVRQLPKDLTEKADYVARSLESLKSVLKTAEDYGVQYCFEIVNRFEQFLLNTAEEGAAFCKATGSPNAKLLLDTFHMNIEEDSLADAIHTAGFYLGHFHIGEANRKTPGVGRMPWHEIGKALREIDYRGAVVMEPFIAPGGQVGEDIRVWRDLSKGADEAEMDAKAGKACRFMKAVLESAAE
ncbi:sugar phosphate isomerase/epimerase family protein [Yeguia hominis]|uniref:Sugar phosphate isomerase/epimerase n=1 Tax=Yeguia hominis TaxID=2763662 RepID=A0A926D6T9_9FIRM|nr:sugar phosphate isomerase/epimerase [Yeguia hominis]MBC8532492.1 sugar phosphate isomerase/epimerase [Yeguia hominis]